MSQAARKIVCLIFLAIAYKSVSILAGNADEVERAVKEHAVVPDVIATAPKHLLKITYNDGLQVEKGNELTPTQVRVQPIVEWDAEAAAYYTLIMTDPDAPSRADPKFREFNHWLVGNILGRDISAATTIRAYIGSGPPEGTGLHRYVFLLYKQAGHLQFDEPPVGSNSRTDRPKFSAANFAKKYNLGEPIAVNFYQAQWDEYVPILHKQLSGN